MPGFQLKPGETSTLRFELYAGPKLYHRLAQLELRINGKGVVNDAIRRPNFLYRFLLGLLPF